ncbi:hypothetical protein EWM64_g7185 [Hericium alpestre]|uniref:EF-hand domain-containing protein n=1 Tax=Hericium alpestre TaxID=135208 RepID=A0A4Y9ZTK5_9AGAM|nr:hypothetical protein EWM64_g7185 [Hericium alpestre]
MSSEQPDASFLALPASLRTKIDRAFDHAVSGPSSSGLSRTKAKQRAVPEGGFVLPEDDEPAPDDAPGGFIPEAGPSAGGFLPDDTAGGFIIEDEDVEDSSDKPTHIALSQIPAALQMLDLPPDDDEVLAVFKNAASGWSGARGGAVGEESVSRKDWRAVCAVLLEAEGEGGDLDEAAEEDEDEDEEAPMEEFRPSSAEESEGGATSDEYVEEPIKKAHKWSAASSRKSIPQRKTRRRAASPSDTSEDEGEEQERPLTARQKRECLKAFALFFPDLTEEADEDAVKGKRLGIRELTKAAGALKEKIKVEEMVEMLETFSTTPDKTMGLADFERMMVSTKMA